ncbi:MAG TPA: tripartite tricarboxylate transporter substrate binding protein [Burkholderiales bacterium]|nr:tripartite tricarboxylate transporter substrate binding protein [Burkholderiales bacterium]
MLRILTAGLLILMSWAGGVAAQEAFPARPINLVSPYPPGGAADLTARPLAPALEKILKQPVIVVNRTGAGGAVGTQFVSQAPADGYTLVITVFSMCTIPEADRVAGRKPRFTREQFVPIGRINADPTLIIVHPSTPWKSVKQLVADAKKRPNEILYVSAGPYSVAHMSMEIFQQTTGVKMRHLPTTGGGPAMTAIVAGHAFVSALSTGAVTPQAKAGKLRVIGNTGANRHAAFPDIPTMKELGYDMEVYLWVGMFARKEVPAQALDVIRKAVKQAVTDPQFTNASLKMQMPPAYLDAAEFEKWFDNDCARLSAAVRRIPSPDAK